MVGLCVGKKKFPPGAQPKISWQREMFKKTCCWASKSTHSLSVFRVKSLCIFQKCNNWIAFARPGPDSCFRILKDEEKGRRGKGGEGDGSLPVVQNCLLIKWHRLSMYIQITQILAVLAETGTVQQTGEVFAQRWSLRKRMKQIKESDPDLDHST